MGMRDIVAKLSVRCSEVVGMIICGLRSGTGRRGIVKLLVWTGWGGRACRAGNGAGAGDASYWQLSGGGDEDDVAAGTR